MKEIVVVGLGPGTMEHLSLGVWEILTKCERIFLRTSRHPVVEELAARGISFTTFDYLYEKEETFTGVYQAIVETLIHGSAEKVVYGVPGNPLIGEESVAMLLQAAREKSIKVTVKPGMSFLDTVCGALEFDPVEGLTILDALRFRAEDVPVDRHLLFLQVYSRLTAADLKLALLENYPAEHPVAVVQAAGVAGKESIQRLPLCELDHYDRFDHLTSVYVAPYGQGNRLGNYPLDRLVEIMEKLLSPQGCPWDREQDHNSLKPYLLEEAYEVIEAIDSNDMHKLREELGDLLLQVVFHATLAQKRGDFTNNDVIDAICEKLVRRHPHVFSDVIVADAAEVLHNWEQIKAGERGEEKGNARPKVMKRINRALPALLLAEEVQNKARKVGFDWEDAQGAWDKLFEEIDELKSAQKDKLERENEMGDLLFAVVNISRFLGVSPETALLKTINKFIRRFNYIEEYLEKNNIEWKQLSLAQLDEIWEKAKKAGI